jgi:hypothetical protein
MIGSNAMKRADDINQTKCWTATNGHIWMQDYYDDLPPAVRRRLQTSAHNVCPACLVVFFEPEIRARHPGLSYQRALLRAIEVMEAEVRSGRSLKR